MFIQRESSVAQFFDQEIAATFCSEDFRRAASCARNKRDAARGFDSVAIAIFAEHSTAATHNTIMQCIA
jgi:hypothetical protein